MKKKKPVSRATNPAVTDLPMLEIDKLRPYPKNARVHSDDQIARLVGSLQEFGWTRPILVDEKFTILAGHGMYEAAKAAGEERVPVLMKTGLNAKQKRAYVLADNRLAEHSKWDEDLLKLELEALDLDLRELTGFKDFELQKLLRSGEADPSLDDPVKTPKTARVKPGQVWILGRHRLICGDATRAEDVERLLDGARPHLMVTDPPYGVNYDAMWRQLGWTGARSVGKVDNDDRDNWQQAWDLYPGDVIYQWAPAGPSQLEHCVALMAAGFEIRMQIIWAKQHFPIGRGNFHVQHEPCWYAVRKGKKARWNGSRQETTLWEIANASAFGGDLADKTNHSTQKPVECMRRPILNNSKKGDAVYDPFVGSGTTLIACEAEDRVCLAMEINPLYCQMTIDRWEKLSGGKAKKAS